jgi:hypothetical protein
VSTRDQFSRLIDVLLPRGGYVLALWEAYIDESGDEGSDDVFVVSGYLFRSDKAVVMQEKWARALRRVGVPYFHMVDCAHGSGKHYKDLKPEKRDWLARRCIDLIKKNSETGISFVVNPPKWGFKSGREDFDNSYAYIMTMLIGHFFTHINRNDADPDAAIFIEQGHSTQSLARKHLDFAILPDKVFPSGRLPSFSFVAKEQACLLQAADLLAWQTAKYVKDVVNGKDTIRKDFEALNEVDHHTFYLYHHDGVNVVRDYRLIGNRPAFHKLIRSIFSDDEAEKEFLDKAHKMRHFGKAEWNEENIKKFLNGSRFAF